MHRSRLGLLCAASAVTVAVTLSACGSSGSSSTAASGGTGSGPASATAASFTTATPGVLSVGVVGTDAPGFITSADGSKITGIVGDIISGFATKYGLTVKPTVVSDYGAFVLAIQQGKVDLGAGLAYSETRGKIIKYSVPWLEAPLMAITRADFKYDGPASVDPSRVGTGTGVAWVAELQKWNSATKIFSNTATEKQALLSGQIDVALINGDAVMNTPFTAKNAAAHTVNPGDFGIDAKLIGSAEYSATACKNGALMTAYTDYIKGLASSDQLSPIFAKYNSPEGSEPTSFDAPASC